MMSHAGSSDYMSGTLPLLMNQGAYGHDPRSGMSTMNSTSSAAMQMAAAAAKKKGIKSSLGRLFSKKEKVRIDYVFITKRIFRKFILIVLIFSCFLLNRAKAKT